jgi:hypothetical protein
METTTINHNLCNVQTKQKLFNNIFHNIFFIIYFFNIYTNHEDNKYKKNIKKVVSSVLNLVPILREVVARADNQWTLDGWCLTPPIQDSMLSSKSGEERYSGLHPSIHTMFTDCQILFYRQITNFSLHNFPYFLFLKLSHSYNRCYNWWR